MLYCQRITNILSDHDENAYSWLAEPGFSLRELAPRGWDATRGFVEINGQKTRDLDTIPHDCCQVLFIDMPGGPAVWIPIVIGVGLSAITTGAQLLLGGALSRPDGVREDLPPASYRGVQTTVGAGIEIPFILGEVRVGGHIIESYQTPRFDEIPESDSYGTTVTEYARSGAIDSQRLNTRIAWGWGPLELIDHVEIDDNSIADIKGIRYQTHLGTLDQPAVEGFDETQDVVQHSFGDITVAGGPQTYATSQPVNAVLIKLVFTQGLYQIKTSGQPRNRKVQIKVEYKLTTEPSVWTTWRNVYPEAHVRTPFPYWMRLPYLEPGEYDLRITRVTADSSNPNVFDTFEWAETIEVIAGARAHPGIANTGFVQIPQSVGQRPPRKYTARAKGANDVRVYTDPNTYTLQYSRNPAWLFAYWLTHPVIGCGQFFDYDSFESIGQLITWAQHCDDTDRTFGFEFKRRYSAAVVKDMFEMAGNARIIDLAGKWRIIPNVGAVATKMITPAQYEQDTCTWITRYTEERPTRLSGIFRNAARDYAIDALPREDDQVEPDQHVDGEVRLWGITTAAKADHALAIMLSESRIADEVFEFVAGAACRDVRAGDIIKFASLTSGQGVAQGRLTRVENDLVTLHIDQEITLDSGQTYEITVQHQDKTLTTLTLAGVTDDLTQVVTTASDAWNGEPKIGDPYSIGLLGYSTQLLRVESSQVDLETMRVSIRAVKFDPDIYSPTLISDTEPDVEELPDPRRIPDNVTDIRVIQETEYNVNVDWGLPATWPSTPLIWKYHIYYRESGETSWVYAGETNHSKITLFNLEPSTTYEVAAVAVSPDGNRQSLDDATKVSFTTSA